MKQRQIRLRSFHDAQLVETGIRAVAGQYQATSGSIPSPAGSWADTGYVLTDAPMSVVRKAAKMHNVDIPTGRNPDVMRKPGASIVSEQNALGMIRQLANDIAKGTADTKEARDNAATIVGYCDVLLRQVQSGVHANPSLVTFMSGANPPPSFMSRHVQAVCYKHVKDGDFYIHTFGGKDVPFHESPNGRQFIYLDELPRSTGVEMRSDKRIVVLSRPDGKPLADDF